MKNDIFSDKYKLQRWCRKCTASLFWV